MKGRCSEGRSEKSWQTRNDLIFFQTQLEHLDGLTTEGVLPAPAHPREDGKGLDENYR